MLLLSTSVVLCLIGYIATEICTSKICEYNFEIQHGRSMTYKWQGRTYNVVLNGSVLQVETPDRFKRPLPDSINIDNVITADGFQRNVLTINGIFPGPTIEVLEGAQVVVHVTNHLLTSAVSIHWHGIHQKGTPWMDGVSHVTQCPITPGQSFTYRFIASPVGTHWYHDHQTNLRVDGMYGMLIVHPQMPLLPEHHLTLSDWYHDEADTLEITNFGPLNGAGNPIAYLYSREYGPDNVFLSPYFFVSALINGRGQYNNEAPLSNFIIESGKQYRFRVANVASKYGFEISIDSHKLFVVSLDGQEIEPIQVDSIMLNPGERVDFTINANALLDNYWMRSLTLREGTGYNPVKDNKEQGTYAVVQYKGAPSILPVTQRRECTQGKPCVIFNCPWAGFADGINKTCIQVDEARSSVDQHVLDEEYGLSGPVDLELFLNMGFHAAASINGKKFLHPTLPWSDPDYLQGQVTCDRMDCKMADSGCACTQVIHLPYNKTVQLVMANYRPLDVVTHHGMHIHGHNFAILKIGLASFNRTTGYADKYNEDVTCVNSFCKEVKWQNKPKLNLVKPPIKDTINVAARGYTVARFRTTNPGAWLFHCHITNHVSEGMALVFDEAHNHHPEPPSHFPRCSSFKWNEEDFEAYMQDSKDDSQATPPAVKATTTPMTMTDGPKALVTTGSTILEQSRFIDSAYLAGHVTLSNANFIGLIIGCIAVGVATVLLVLIMVWFRSCVKDKDSYSTN